MNFAEKKDRARFQSAIEAVLGKEAARRLESGACWNSRSGRVRSSSFGPVQHR
jgi:hypothetical protein